MIGAVIVLILIIVAILLFVRQKEPNGRTVVVVLPGHKFNRLQKIGLAYAITGLTITVGIWIFDKYHHLNPSFRRGELGYSNGLILIGVMFFLVGWKLRRKPEHLPPN